MQKVHNVRWVIDVLARRTIGGSCGGGGGGGAGGGGRGFEVGVRCHSASQSCVGHHAPAYLHARIEREAWQGVSRCRSFSSTGPAAANGMCIMHAYVWVSMGVCIMHTPILTHRKYDQLTVPKSHMWRTLFGVYVYA